MSQEIIGTEGNVIGRRIFAKIIDTIMIAIIIIFQLLVVALLGVFRFNFILTEEIVTKYFILLALINWVSYGTLLEGRTGQTIGKKLLRIVVVKVGNSPCDYISAFIRNLLIVVDGLFYYIVGLIIIAISEKRQRLGDHLANTVVMKKKLRVKESEVE